MSAVNAQLKHRRRRLGVHAEHESYKWWALSCTSLGMLLATINLARPKHVAAPAPPPTERGPRTATR